MMFQQARGALLFSSATRTLGLLASAFLAKSVVAAALASSPTVRSSGAVVNLQLPHSNRSPAETLQHLAEECNPLGIEKFDVYGDFDQTQEDSFLKRFEACLAEELGMEDAVFMPSGGMAQSIALLIHHHNPPSSSNNNETAPNGQQGKKNQQSCFVCHHSSHLLLHEQEAYRELLNLEPIVVSTIPNAKEGSISIPPMMFEDVEQACCGRHNAQHKSDNNNEGETQTPISTLLLELPHREIGGKLTPWRDVVKMREYCSEQRIRFHLDGARIFEASTGYEDMSLRDIASVFDSVYISFYKGLGGISGAMLLGSKDFCSQARVWLRRFGGNLYTLLPYAVSGWAGYRRQWKLQGNDDDGQELLSFEEKKNKLVGLVAALSEPESASSRVVVFDPAIPETNMVHGYIRNASPEDCTELLDAVEQRTSIRVLSRVRPVSEEEPAYRLGFRSKFEWPMGEANGGIPDDDFLRGWKEFSMGLIMHKETTTSSAHTSHSQ